MAMSSSAAAVDAGGGSEPAATTSTMPTSPAADVVPIDSSAAEVDVEALDALAAALTTDHGAVDVCRRAAGFLLARVPGSVAVQITMHGATADAPPQVFTFPRRPPNAESAKGGYRESESESGSESESESGSESWSESERGEHTAAAAASEEDDKRASAAAPLPSSSSKINSEINGGSDDTSSLAAVSGSHAGSDRTVSWSVKGAETGPSSPPYSDWRSLAESHAATAFLTVPASVSGRPRASLTVAGSANAGGGEGSSGAPAFPAPPSPAAAAAAATASAVAALLAPYLALAAVRRQLDVAQALLADVMPHSVMAGVVERRALGLAPAMFGGGGGGGSNGGGNGTTANTNNNDA